MFERIGRSWQLLRVTITIVLANKKLLIFPVLSMGFMAGIFLFFALPNEHPLNTSAHWGSLAHQWFEFGVNEKGKQEITGPKPLAAVYGVVVYLSCMVGATFVNVAMYSQIMALFRREEISVRAGLRFATQRIWPILGWSLFAGAVGYIIRQIEDRSSVVGSIIAGLIGLAWSVASVFAIPVIVYNEGMNNPFAILKESSATLRKVWGDSLVGYVGLSAANLLVVLGTFLEMGAFIWLGLTLANVWLIVAGVTIFGLFFIVYSYFVQVAQQVFISALYLYSSFDYVSEPYSQDLFALAWKYKKS